MPSFTTDQGILHYEVYGRGRPVIFLHGWLGSWGLWQSTMTRLGSFYRMYAMDFWGFGESGRKQNAYLVQDYIDLVDQFMEHLGIESAPLVGHSMGGTVSLAVAIQYPQRVRKAVVIGSPICGSSLSLLLKIFGQRFAAWVAYKNLSGLKLGFSLLAPLYSRDPNWYSMMERDLSQTTLESFLMSIASLRRTDLRPNLPKISVPVMGMYGDKDNLSTRNNGNLYPRLCLGLASSVSTAPGTLLCWMNQNYLYPPYTTSWALAMGRMPMRKSPWNCSLSIQLKCCTKTFDRLIALRGPCKMIHKMKSQDTLCVQALRTWRALREIKKVNYAKNHPSRQQKYSTLQ